VLFRSSRKKFKEIRKELEEEKEFLKILEETYHEVRKKQISLSRYEAWNKLIYYIIRIKKPEIVIETGVFDGITTSFF